MSIFNAYLQVVCLWLVMPYFCMHCAVCDLYCFWMPVSSVQPRMLCFICDKMLNHYQYAVVVQKEGVRKRCTGCKIIAHAGCAEQVCCMFSMHVFSRIPALEYFNWERRVSVILINWLTLSVPHFSDCSKMSLPNRSGPYWSNPPFF